MNRSTVFLIVLLLLLGIVAYFLLPSEKDRETSYKPAEINLSIDSASIIKIEIQRTGKSVTLDNVGGKWMMTAPLNYAADVSSVQQVISGMVKFKVGSLISSNVEKQAVFQVDTTGTKLTMTERGGKSISLVIGKMGPSFSEVYFRMPGSKEVYLGEGIESWSINKEAKDWRDKTIFSSPSELIKELMYTAGNKEYSFHRDSTGWKSADKAVDANTMNPILNSLASLRADDFVDTVMKPEAHPVKLNVRGNENLDLNIYPSLPDSSKYYVQSSKSAQMFVISKWTAQQLLKPLQRPGSTRQASEIASTPPQKTEEKPSVPVVDVKKKAEEKPAPPIAIAKKKEGTKTSSPSANQKKESGPKVSPPITTVKKERPKKEKPPVSSSTPQQKDVTEPNASKTSEASETTNPPAKNQPSTKTSSQSPSEDDGDLTVHTVAKGETMQTIAKKYNVSVEQIIKWNLLKTIAVKPGQELYIFVKNPSKK